MAHSVYIPGGPKNHTSLGEISAKRWPQSVKFGNTFVATFLDISAENYTNVV